MKIEQIQRQEIPPEEFSSVVQDPPRPFVQDTLTAQKQNLSGIVWNQIRLTLLSIWKVIQSVIEKIFFCLELSPDNPEVPSPKRGETESP